MVLPALSAALIQKLLYGTFPLRCANARMGELEPWVDEAFVRNIWYQMGEQVNVKMIRDKFSGYVNLLTLLMVEITLDTVLWISCRLNLRQRH